MLMALSDNSLMLSPSKRDPVHYLCLGRILAMALIYNARGEVTVILLSLIPEVLNANPDPGIKPNIVTWTWRRQHFLFLFRVRCSSLWSITR